MHPNAVQVDEAPEQIEQETPAPKTSLAPIVERNTLKQLGRPSNLHLVKACPVGPNRFRVNVYCTEGEDLIKTNRITDSFYLIVDDAGNILPSSDEIVKKYE